MVCFCLTTYWEPSGDQPSVAGLESRFISALKLSKAANCACNKAPHRTNNCAGLPCASPWSNGRLQLITGIRLNVAVQWRLRQPQICYESVLDPNCSFIPQLYIWKLRQRNLLPCRDDDSVQALYNAVRAGWGVRGTYIKDMSRRRCCLPISSHTPPSCRFVSSTALVLPLSSLILQGFGLSSLTSTVSTNSGPQYLQTTGWSARWRIGLIRSGSSKVSTVVVVRGGTNPRISGTGTREFTSGQTIIIIQFLPRIPRYEKLGSTTHLLRFCSWCSWCSRRQKHHDHESCWAASPHGHLETVWCKFGLTVAAGIPWSLHARPRRSWHTTLLHTSAPQNCTLIDANLPNWRRCR